MVDDRQGQGQSEGVDVIGERKPCKLVELLQYHCVLHPNDHISCQPIERIFRQCIGRPSVEVTHIAEYDEETRKWRLPAHLETAMPKSHHWHELT